MYSEKVLEFFKKKNVKLGDWVKIKTKEGNLYDGIIMPRSEFGDADCIVLKLKNGYNVGISIDRIKSISVVVDKKSREKKHVEKTKDVKKTHARQDENKKTITILHTGGTIASRIDYESGAVKALFSPGELLDMFPELENYANIKSRLIANTLSENLRFGHYNMIIDEVVREIKRGVNGVIITHGTDTMAYTASALSFALENLPIPVILVGAQRSSDRPSSDAALNLISAVQFITRTDFCEVAICMHATASDDYCHILPACKTRKMHSSARFAFQPVNALPYARVWPKEERIEIIDSNYRKRGDVKKELVVRKFKEHVKVGMLKAHPNMLAEELLAFKGFDGLVIEGTGLGHIGIEVFDEHSKDNRAVEAALRAVIESGTIVVMTTQCLYGRVNMNVYSTGRKLIKAGVLGNLTDMLPEVAFVKLAWLLSNFERNEAIKLLHENLRGEISERSLTDFYLPR